MKNNMFSQEYIAALAIVIVGILQLFKVEIGTELVTGLIVSALGIWSAIRRYQKGDITVLGKRKI